MDDVEMLTTVMEDPSFIPEFTFEDFTETFKPFDYVASFRDDLIVYEQKLIIIDKKAKKLKINNFKSMMKKYMEKLHPQIKNVYVNTTEFDGQEYQLNCGNYFCNDAGVSVNTDKEYDVEICNHPIMPVQRLVNIDDNTEKLKIAYKKGFRWREIIVDKATLASSNKILELAKYGVAVNSENAKLLVKFFTDIENLNYHSIKELNSVSRLGWIADKGFSPYVEDLVFDGNESFRTFFKSVHFKGDIEKWIEICMNIRKNDDITARIMLSASFASVLVEVCDCLPFFVHLWGGTESGKTVALMLSASVWANPAMGDYIHTFNSTAVAQELSAGFVNSLPLIIDELQIIKDKKDFDNIIYQLSEGVGRARGQKSGGLQKVATWRNCILTNGEYPISGSASGGGAINRIIEIDCKDVKIFKNPVEVVDVLKKNYGGAGMAFIEYLKQDNVLDKVKKRQREIYRQLLNESDTTEKQAMSASLILLADEIIEDVFFSDGIKLKISDLKPYLASKAQVNQNQRCLDFIYDFVAVNGNKFKRNADCEFQNEIWGSVGDGYIYIIKSIFDKILRDNGYNSTAFLSWAKMGNLLKTESGHNTVRKRLQGNQCRCVAILVQTDSVADDDLPFDK